MSSKGASDWLVVNETKARSIVDVPTINTMYQDDKQRNRLPITLDNVEIHSLGDNLDALKEVGDLNQFHKTI